MRKVVPLLPVSFGEEEGGLCAVCLPFSRVNVVNLHPEAKRDTPVPAACFC